MKTDPLPEYGRDSNLWPSLDLNYAHTDGKILGIINNVKCCFLHDAFTQRASWENFFVDWNIMYLNKG